MIEHLKLGPSFHQTVRWVIDWCIFLYDILVKLSKFVAITLFNIILQSSLSTLFFVFGKDCAKYAWNACLLELGVLMSWIWSNLDHLIFLCMKHWCLSNPAPNSRFLCLVCRGKKMKSHYTLAATSSLVVWLFSNLISTIMLLIQLLYWVIILQFLHRLAILAAIADSCCTNLVPDQLYLDLSPH